MLKNYLKVAIRNIRRQKLYSIITISGFTLGMTCCLLILLYVKHESGYDSFYPDSDRIYRIATEVTGSTGTSHSAATPAPVGPALKAEYSEFEYITRIYFQSDMLFEYEDKHIFEDNVIFADPEFFKVFPFRVLKSQSAQLLNSPDSLVLTARAAEKYFGKEDPIGKSIRIDREQSFQITGVIEDVPSNSHFHFDFIVSFLAKNEKNFGTWLNLWTGITSLYTYAVLPKTLNIEEFSHKVEDVITEHSGKRPGVTWKIFLQRLRSIYLYSHLEDEIKQNNFVSNLIMLSTIAFLILVIACFNYMNLATSQSARRAKEVGMRKVLGAEGRQLIRQFVGESIFLTMIALCLSLLLVEILIPSFAALVGKPVLYNLSENLPFVAAFVLIAIIVGAASSLYPAIFLSRHQPVKTIKNQKETDRSSTAQMIFKKGLVVSQFFVSILLIICTLIINSQLHYMRTAHLGFDKEHTIVIPFYDESSQKHYESIKHELMKYEDVIGATACLKPPIADNVLITSAFPRGKEAGFSFNLQLNAVDYDFIDNFGIGLVAGRNFSPEYSTDSKEAMIINETAVGAMGYSSPEDALGKALKTGYYGLEGTIIGVVRDHHISSFHEEIEPMAMVHYPELFYSMAIKIRSQRVRQTLAAIEKTWTQFIPEYPFAYSYLDADIDRLYRAEEQTAKIIRTFSIIAIFIACLGLFGLAAHTAQKRTKEIGIRKVLGASEANLVVMLSSEFTKWILLANVLAWPIAYYVMHRWLRNFAYRASIDIRIFVLAAGSAFLIALLTVSYHAIKSALANPVKSLRYE
ncbi:MAG: ABC transporter permease [Candidatus Aminicenantes bacterium]|nr:ABC transporter permease [Candidatus Aminicenantes bacterium]